MTDLGGLSSFPPGGLPPPDLHTQFEDILTHVFRCETWERLEDRIDLALRVRRDRPEGRQ